MDCHPFHFFGCRIKENLKWIKLDGSNPALFLPNHASINRLLFIYLFYMYNLNSCTEAHTDVPNQLRTSKDQSPLFRRGRKVGKTVSKLKPFLISALLQ